MRANTLVCYMAAAMKPRLNKKEARAAAWRLFRAMWLRGSCEDTVCLDTLKVCPKCLSGSWLVARGDTITCFNCGTGWIVLEMADGKGYHGNPR